MKRVISLTLALLILILPTILAPDTEQETPESTVDSIILTVNENDISWETTGHSKNGFKVTWSKNENPTYPLREGDKYHYYSDPNHNADTLTAFSGEGIYYARVCEYLGGKCGLYSNQVEISITNNYDNKEIEEKENKGVEEKNKPAVPTLISQEPICNGCQSNETCYPLGYRLNKTFCANNHNLTPQLTEESICENNFECESNVCVSGECISAGFIQKVISWLKRFF